MTYQVGAENMIDPYIDDALVSLSELRDAQFSGDLSKFACGANFVIGESVVAGVVPDMKKVDTVENLPKESLVSPRDGREISEIKE